MSLELTALRFIFVSFSLIKLIKLEYPNVNQLKFNVHFKRMSIGVIVENKLILGGGASGLSSAVLLPNSIIIESSSKVGGLSNSKSIDGFTFDQGPHIMFSRDKEVLSVMVDSLRGNVHTCMRNNVVMINGSLVRYPIENDLSSLPANVRINALQDFLRMRISPISSEPKNLEEWFLRNFGETLTNIYFKPYNEKIWNLPFSDFYLEDKWRKSTGRRCRREVWFRYFFSVFRSP